MDLRRYYHDVAKIAAEMEGEYVLVTSLATSDGGRAGVVSEVERVCAARMVVDKLARVATEEEKAEFAAKQAAVADERSSGLGEAATLFAMLADALPKPVRRGRKADVEIGEE